jgi:hypothetical protein
MTAIRVESAAVTVAMFLALCWGQESASQTRKCQLMSPAVGSQVLFADLGEHSVLYCIQAEPSHAL